MGEQNKILQARAHLLQLADVVQNRIAVKSSSATAAQRRQHHERLRASELDLRNFWRNLQRLDPNASSWLRAKSYAYDLVMNPQAPPARMDPIPELVKPKMVKHAWVQSGPGWTY